MVKIEIVQKVLMHKTNARQKKIAFRTVLFCVLNAIKAALQVESCSCLQKHIFLYSSFYEMATVIPALHSLHPSLR